MSRAPLTAEPELDAPDEQPETRPRYGLALLLFALSCASTTFVGAQNGGLQSGLAFSVPLMSILLAHELGHYVAARVHRVPASLPYFIPIPVAPLGTMGAVILMRQRIQSRNALLDIGAAGPLAGLVVALPVLAYGIAMSPVSPSPPSYMQEGHSLLYLFMLRALKGEIPPGQDIQLSPTAFAGWAGLLVTMINLIPALQLDGGHVAYALLGERYHALSRFLRRALLPLALGIALLYGIPAYSAGKRGDALWGELMPATQWFTWWLLLWFLGRRGGHEHPPTDDSRLSPCRRAIALFTLGMFVLLFMPAWLRLVSS
jgi:membrane-associated protease RseP (regulator of RpoE activity)